MLTEEQKQRYNRQIILQDFGERGQEILLCSKCLVVGVGGLGSIISLYLAAAGAGTIGLVDNDNVSISNLQRQIVYREKQQGLPKATTAAQNLKALNSGCNFVAYDCFLTEENAEEIISKYDIVLDATDNFKSRYLINDTCKRLGKPFVYSSISATCGQVALFDFPNCKSSYRSLYPDEEQLSKRENPSKAVIGVLPGVAACIATNEAIKYLAKMGESLSDKLLCFDISTNVFQTFDIE